RVGRRSGRHAVARQRTRPRPVPDLRLHGGTARRRGAGRRAAPAGADGGQLSPQSAAASRTGALVRWWSARNAVLRWAAVALAMGVLWWSSEQPGNPLGTGAVAEYLHNGAHVVAYGALAALALTALSPPGGWSARPVLAAVLIAGCYGAVDEL